MTELCIYQTTNTVLKINLIIVVFHGNLTDVRKERRTHEKKKLKLVGILAAVVLIGSVISIPLINNHTAYKVEKALCEIPLPEETELIESLSQAGKLTGNGNGMQYFGAILIRSELSLEELETYVANDGARGEYEIEWLDDGVQIILSGEEQPTAYYILPYKTLEEN